MAHAGDPTASGACTPTRAGAALPTCVDVSTSALVAFGIGVAIYGF